jgi:hypothetical protein
MNDVLYQTCWLDAPVTGACNAPSESQSKGLMTYWYAALTSLTVAMSTFRDDLLQYLCCDSQHVVQLFRGCID